MINDFDSILKQGQRKDAPPQKKAIHPSTEEIEAEMIRRQEQREEGSSSYYDILLTTEVNPESHLTRTKWRRPYKND